MGQNLFIVGAGQAAAQAIPYLIKRGYPGQITLVGEEKQLPYQRPPLSKDFLVGESSEDRLQLRPQEFYDSNNIELIQNTRVESIDVKSNNLELSNGEKRSFDNLLLTTGASARHISLPGSDMIGVYYLRGIDDVNQLQPQLQSGKHIVIIGAGYIGLEVASSARKLGLNVMVLEAQERVLKRVVSPQMSDFFQKLHNENGVDLRVSTEVSGIIGSTTVEYVELADGTMIKCDLVLIAVGSKPNDELAVACGIATEDGILVDESCQTSSSNVYAAGDCTRFYSKLFERKIRLESVQNAIDQAKFAANTICGRDEIYNPIPWFWSDQYDIKLQITGLAQDYDDSVVVGDPNNKIFYIAYLKSGNLIAVDSVNHPRSHMSARRVIGESWHNELLPSI